MIKLKFFLVLFLEIIRKKYVKGEYVIFLKDG